MNGAVSHQTFSLGRIRAIASNTFLELVRQKVFSFMILFAALGIGASFVASSWNFREQFQVVKDVSLGAMSVFSWLLATLATAIVIPKDIEERTLYTILAKPVSRVEYLLGKLFGVMTLLLVAIGLMSAFFAVVLFARGQIALAEAAQGFPPGPELDAALAHIKATAFDTRLIPAILLIFTKVAVCASLTLMISSFSTSWIFTVMISTMVYIIGHVQPIAREFWRNREAMGGSAASPLLKDFIGFVAIIFPDFQSFNIVDEIVVGNAVPVSMFLESFGMGLGYVFIFTLVGYILFAYREL
jgi:ABC-2 type transport system permease protein